MSQTQQAAKKFEGAVGMAVNALKANPGNSKAILAALAEQQPKGPSIKPGDARSGDFAHVLEAIQGGADPIEAMEAWVRSRRGEWDQPQVGLTSQPVARGTALKHPRQTIQKAIEEHLDREGANQMAQAFANAINS